MTDASAQLAEKATYCKTNDPKAPRLVGLPDATTSQICPDDGSQVPELTDAYPDGWFVRVMFDELLDPNIEQLVDEDGAPCDTTSADALCSGTIAASHPVDLKCTSSIPGAGMVNVSYDGYYSPSGNSVTWPLGPSLVIKPNDPTAIATNTECEITLGGNIVDKDGIAVPTEQRGPFKFKVAPIKVIAFDPADDPDYTSPIPAVQIYYDNPYIQFNTTVDPGSIEDLLADDGVFSIKDVAHPAEGPGYCNDTGNTCGSLADCESTDTVCGKGFCSDGTPCNLGADCPLAPNDACLALYEYNYAPYGATDAEFGIGPFEPIETEHKYILSFTEGAKLKDRCGVETALPAPTADNLELAHIITDKYDFVKASIANGETASAMKRLQYNWTNVVEGADFGGDETATSDALDLTATRPEFTLAPLPKVLTGPCTTSSCPTTEIAPDSLIIVSADASGQLQLQGHYQMNTEYTATVKAGAIVKDFYGKTWTNTSDSVIKWKTAPAIVLSSLAVRQPGTVVNITDGGTVVKPTPGSSLSVRLAFNASMDPTSLDSSEVTVEAVGDSPAAPTLAVSTPSGCGYFDSGDPSLGDNSMGWLGTCSLTLSGAFPAGDYTITVKQGATFKDIFGTTYTQAADQSITITVEEAPAPVQCL